MALLMGSWEEPVDDSVALPLADVLEPLNSCKMDGVFNFCTSSVMIHNASKPEESSRTE